MYVMDRPLIPKYTRAKLASEAVSPPSTTSSRSSSGVSSQLNSSGRSFNFNDGNPEEASLRSNGPPSTVTTRVLSSTSLQSGRPYSTTDEGRRSRRPSITSNASVRPNAAATPAACTAGPASSWAKKQVALQQQRNKKKTSTVSGDSGTSSRQWSADSGIEEGDDSIDAKFILPPRITTYLE